MRKRIKKMTACILTALLGLSIMNFPVHAQETQANQQVENNAVSIKNMESLFIGESMFKTAVQALTATEPNNAGPFYVEGDTDGWKYDDIKKTLTFSKDGNYKVTGDGNVTNVQIIVEANIAITLTVKDVNCYPSGAGMSIDGTANATLILQGENEFVSGNYSNAGIEFNNATGSLTIDGTGSVKATGGENGAGIGGGNGNSGNRITISSGTVIARGSNGGAGIGGGMGGTGNNITINGGNITATGNGGAGIGGGNYKFGSNITISGGTVTATSTSASGIGSGAINWNSSNIVITGGSVKATGAQAISVTPTDGVNPVYLAKLDIADNVNQIKVDGKDYQIEGKHESDTSYYLYMTEKEHYIETESNVYKSTWNAPGKVFDTITTPIKTGDLKVTGGAYGIDYIFDNTKNTLTFNTDGKYSVIGDKITAEQIVIGKNRNIELTVHNVKCHHNGWGAGMSIDGTSTVTLILEGENEFIAGGPDSAGIEFNNATNGSLTIDGTGSVTAIGSVHGAGIGGFYKSSGNNIIINGGSIISTSEEGAGIGGGYNESSDNIVINGGTVTATSKIYEYAIGGDISLTSGTIEILGGSVKAIGNNTSDKDAMGATPTDGVNPVYLAKLDINENVNSIKVDGKDYKIQGKHENDNAYYLYMTAGNHYIETDSNVYFAKWNSSKNAFDPVVIATNDGDLQVEGGTYGIDYMYDDVQNTLTFKKDGNYIVTSKKTEAIKERIVVDAGLKMSLTVKGVICHPNTGAGMSIDGTSIVSLILEGNNEFVAGNSDTAGIEFNNATTGSLTIDGPGSLLAKGGTRGAGIGGGEKGSAKNITINGGVIDAKGGSYGAGIGGGRYGEATAITIKGGTITATAGSKGGAGIGGGFYGAGTDITISDRTVIAEGSEGGAGIGGGPSGLGSDITISGGIVTATGAGAGIGGGDFKGGNNIIISGGTVIAKSSEGAGIGGGAGGIGTDITISDGIVKANSISGAAIGGGYGNYGIAGGNGENITISGGAVIAESIFGSGIGGGFGTDEAPSGIGENITISGGTVTAKSTSGAGIGDGENGTGSSGITITGGSVKATKDEKESISVTPTNGNNKSVYLVKLPNQDNVDEVIVDSGTISSTTFKRAGNHPEGDTSFYLYLTGEDHYLSVDGVQYKALWNSSTSTFSIQPAAPNVEIASQTASTITVKEPAEAAIYGGVMYSMDNQTWQTSNIFENLDSSKDYTIYMKYKGNNTYIESEVAQKTVKTSSASYTITIPSTTLTAGNSESKNEISATSMDLGYSGQVNVKVADNGNISKDGKLKLTRMQDVSTAIKSALLVNGAAFNDISKYIATFKSTADKPVSISFAKPTEANIPAGTYTGSVTFEVTYTQ